MATTTDAAPGEAKADEAKAGGKRKKLIVGVVVLLVVVAAVYMLVLKPKSSGPAKPPKPVAGPVVKLDPITINLAGGHFLKLGLSLQASASAGEDVSGAKALDAAIDLFSGRTVDDLAKRDGRDKAKQALVKEVGELYEQKVYDVYFTDFVMQ